MTSTVSNAAPGRPDDGSRELLEPSAGVPPITSTSAALAASAARLATGSGPVAVDAERASGYRYGQRAYLVQLRREDAGTVLVDPVELADLSPLQNAVADAEWVLHAASQDLPCLAEVGLAPSRLFDTELAGRLAGFERVGLAAMVERMLGYRLEKGHSAADWSTRPLPEAWLRYAALDVELLVPLRDALQDELAAQGKLGWAGQEFAALLAAPPRGPRAEPWRSTSGIHRIRTRRQLAVLRALWTAREELARSRDIAPGRVLPDSAVVEAALAAPVSLQELLRLPRFSGPRMQRNGRTWWAAVQKAAALPEAELPTSSASARDGLPPTGRWAERDPAAAARLVRVRTALATLATHHRLPIENLLEPALFRRLAWAPPAEVSDLPQLLAARGARPWQRELVAAPLAAALTETDGG